MKTWALEYKQCLFDLVGWVVKKQDVHFMTIILRDVEVELKLFGFFSILIKA